MAVKHEHHCTFLDLGGVDADILTRPGFDVNLRLYQSAPQYRAIVQQCAEYILWAATTEKDGYKAPHGFSGANAGIPFNIIATARPPEVMLNPRVLAQSVTHRVSLSNCGSLRLPEPIEVSRPEWVEFEFWDLDGVRHVRRGYFPTVQHEIDHNQGILITDRRA